MLQFKRILTPTDFSEPSLEGLRAAIGLAEKFDAELILAHVTDTPAWMALAYSHPQGIEIPEVMKALREEAAERLSKIQSENIPGHIRSRLLTDEGPPAEKIVQLAKAQDADLIVIATHGYSEFHRFIFGSVTERVVRTAACPVLTIRPKPADKGHK